MLTPRTLFVMLFILLFANLAAAQESTEGDTCVAYIVDDETGSTLYGMNLAQLTPISLASEVFDFAVDPVNGDVYLAQWVAASYPYGFQIQKLGDEDILHVSSGSVIGMDALNGTLLVTDATRSLVQQGPVWLTYTIAINGNLTALENTGWPALGPEGVLLHQDRTTTYGDSLLGVDGQYPFSFSVTGDFVYTENFTTLWLWETSHNILNITPDFEDNEALVAADWLPDGRLILTTNNVDTSVSTLYAYDFNFPELVELTQATWIAHPQTIPCDYLLQ